MDDQTYRYESAPARDRRWHWSTARRIAATAGAGAVLMGSGIGLGVAFSGGASAATSGSPLSVKTSHSAATPAARCSGLAAQALAKGNANAARKLHAFCSIPAVRLVLAGGLHGELTVKAKTGFRTVIFERGTVESAAGQAVTVRAPDGTTWTWQLVSNAILRESGSKVSANELATGDQVLVIGQVVNGANEARLMNIRPAS
jgi:hypothetical protein